jgi:signal transduction histidine kinase
VLQVANGGPVLEAAAAAALFEPFQRGRRDRAGLPRGFGLGLAIVRSVASAHDGEVAAISPAEGGLVVTVRLPIAPAPPIPPA